MPGSTPNPNILLGLDEVIKAINDVSLVVNNGDTNVQVDIASIVAKLEEMRTLYETRSLAETTAQNTNFNDLIAAISALTLSCQTIVNTTNVTNRISCGGCNPGGNAPNPPATDGGNGIDPPPGMTIPTGNSVLDRACKLSNAFHENIRLYIEACNQRGIDGIANNVVDDGIALLMAYLGTIVGELSTPIPLIDATVGGVIGYVLGMAVSFIQGDYSLDRMSTILNDPLNQEDFICAAYNATNSGSVISNYLQVASDKGMTFADTELLAAIATYDLANYVFFAREQYIEDAIANSSYSFNCSTCEGAIVWEFETDDEGWYYSGNNTTGGNSSGSWENGSLAFNFDRVQNGLISGQWWYNGPRISEIQEGMNFIATLEGVNPCASGAGIGLYFTDGTVQYASDGNAWNFGEVRELGMVIQPFNGKVLQSIWVDSHTEIPCTTPGNYKMYINRVVIS